MYGLVIRAQEMCERLSGRPVLPVPNSPYGLCGRKATLNIIITLSEFRNYVNVDVAVLGSPPLTVRT